MADQSDTAAETDTATTKSAAKKTAAKKAPAKKAAPKKRAVSTAKKVASSDSGSRTRKAADNPRPNAVKIARAAREQLSELLDKDSETVIGVQRTDDGWEVDLEIVETRRIPDTTDVLAIYRVQLDSDGEIKGYQRVERHIRGKAEGGVTGG